MNAWSSVNITILEDVSQVSAVVASLSEKKEELSVESQVLDIMIVAILFMFMLLLLMLLLLLFLMDVYYLVPM